MKGPSLAINGLALALLLLLLTVPAHATTTNATMTFHDTTASMPVTPIACPSGTTIPGGMLTFTYNGVMHATNDTAGGIHFTMTIAGDFTLLATSGVTFTGHLNVWFGGTAHFVSNGASEFSFTISAHASGTDGSTFDFHIVAHVTISANGPPPTIMFMKVTC